MSVGKKRLLAVLLAFLTLLAWALLGSKYGLEVTHEQDVRPGLDGAL